MSAGRVITAVAKVGVFCSIVIIGVVIFRGGSVSARLSEAWAMRWCDKRLQADLNVLLMERSPKVGSCAGPSTRAVCQVETTEWRRPTGTATAWPARVTKTAPLGPWDCGRRHVPDGLAGLVMKTLIDSKTDGDMDSALLKVVDVSPHQKELLAERGAIGSLLSQRQALVDAD